MSEITNYCDAPNGPCIAQSKLEADYKVAFSTMIQCYLIIKQRTDDDDSSRLSAVYRILFNALQKLRKVDDGRA